MKKVAADLHVHTVLSPCAEPEMTPEAIIAEALRRGLGLIAICDHNCAENGAAMLNMAGGRLSVIPGMEITTAEEVHVVGLFPDAGSALQAGLRVRSAMAEPVNPQGSGRSQYPGLHMSFNKGIGMSAEATSLSLSEAVELIHENGGLAVAAHVDRPSYSVFSQLGLWPENAGFDAVEVSPVAVRESRIGKYVGIGLPVIASSDSHFLSDIGCCRTILQYVEGGLAELSRSLKGPLEWRFCGA